MTRRRTCRAGRRRPTLADHLLCAGIAGGGLYLLLHDVLTVPPFVAAVAGLVAFGFTLGTTVPAPRYRSPIVWTRKGRH